MVYQRDIEVTTNFALAVCSVGALMSVVFAIMGIKWWFRRRITFGSNNDRREGSANNAVEGIESTDNHAEQLSLMNIGVYRRTADADEFAPIDRPKTLPPVKVRNEHFNQRRRLPIPRPQSSYDSSGLTLEKFPEPAEVIPVPLPLRKNHTPPLTLSSPSRNDLSQPVVVDIHIPGDEPKVRQRLEPEFKKVTSKKLTHSYIEMDGGPGPVGERKSHAYETITSIESVNEVKDDGYVEEYNETYISYQSEIDLDENVLYRSSSLDPDAIESDANKSLGTSPSSNSWIPNPIMKPRRSFLSEGSSDSNPVLHLASEPAPIPPPLVFSASNPKLDTSISTIEAALESQVRAQSAEGALEMDMTPLDVSKIVSPLPRRSKRGLVKNRRAPPPPPPPTADVVPARSENEAVEVQDNVTRIYISGPSGDDWFTEKATEIEVPQWEVEASEGAQSTKENHELMQHSHHHNKLADFYAKRGVSIDEDEIFAALEIQKPKIVDQKLQHDDAAFRHDINQNFISHGFDTDEDKIFAQLGIDKTLVNIAPIPKPRWSQENEPWEIQKAHEAFNDEEEVIKIVKNDIPPTPPATSPPLFDDDFGNIPLGAKSPNVTTIQIEAANNEERRSSVLLELYVEDDVVKEFSPTTSDMEQSQSKPVAKARTTSLEDLTRDTSSSSEDNETRDGKAVPTPPPRLKIYSINSSATNQEQQFKSILKNKSNKNVTFDETQPTVIVPTLLSPESVLSSPGLTPVTPMLELSSPPLTPAPVLTDGSSSPVLVPREYRRGLLDPITETRQSDISSDDYDTDSLEEARKPANGENGADDSDSDDDRVRTRMITGPKVLDTRHSQMMDELRNRQTRRDYVAPRNLREMSQQQQQQLQKQDEAKFRDSLSEDESII